MAPSVAERTGTATILVVDDTPVNLAVLVSILEGSGYRILVARNGRSALDIAKRAQPDLVLLDVAMPEMSGFDVCRAMKADASISGAVVIFISAHGELADKVSGLELGAADYITKPFQSEEVLARVRGHLHRKQLEHDLRVSRDGLDKEMRSAGEMQRLLLPRTFPDVAGVSFAAHYRPSLYAGGDYYDVRPLAVAGAGAFVADVSGHGAKAAIVMAMMRTLLHASDRPLDDPAAVLARMNDHFAYLRETSTYATALCGFIEPGLKRLRLARAGHPAPLLIRAGHPIAPVSEEGATPLIMFETLSMPQTTHALRAGDRLVFYTDGITERESPDGEMFGLDRLTETLARVDGSDLDAMLRSVIDAVETFAEGEEPSDDQTILLAEVR